MRDLAPRLRGWSVLVGTALLSHFWISRPCTLFNVASINQALLFMQTNADLHWTPECWNKQQQWRMLQWAVATSEFQVCCRGFFYVVVNGRQHFPSFVSFVPSFLVGQSYGCGSSITMPIILWVDSGLGSNSRVAGMNQSSMSVRGPDGQRVRYGRLSSVCVSY